MVAVQILKITDSLLRKFLSQENAEKCRKLHNNEQSLNEFERDRRVKCKQTKVNYRIFHNFAENSEF